MRGNRIGWRRSCSRPSPRLCGHAGRAASVGFMASKPPSPDDDQIPAAADGPVAPELDKKPVADTTAPDRVVSDKTAASSPPDDDDELEDDDEDDEDLVVFTSKDAAGAL